MPLRNKSYGQPRTCEHAGCDRTRGAPLACEKTYGCVLCTFHENEYQLGEISLPDSASDARKNEAWDQILA